MPKDKYHAYFKDKGVIHKKEILFATCHYDFRFRNANAENTEEIIRQRTSNFMHNIYFVPKQSKLSNLGDRLYISLQPSVDVITKNEEVIWSIFAGQTNEEKLLTNYLNQVK